MYYKYCANNKITIKQLICMCFFELLALMEKSSKNITTTYW